MGTGICPVSLQSSHGGAFELIPSLFNENAVRGLLQPQPKMSAIQVRRNRHDLLLAQGLFWDQLPPGKYRGRQRRLGT